MATAKKRKKYTEETLPCDIDELKILHAAIVTAPLRGEIKAISYPQIKEKYWSLEQSDIPGEKEIVEFNGRVKLLNRESVSYPNEPVALVAAERRELLREIVEGVKVEYGKKESQKRERALLFHHCFNSNTLSSPSFESKKIIKKEYNFHLHPYGSNYHAGIFASFKREKLYLHMATCWPGMVKRSIEKVAQIEFSNIELLSVKKGKRRQEDLWFSTQLACYASLLSLKSKRPVHLLIDEKMALEWGDGGKTSIQIEGSFNREGLFELIKIRAEIEVGAYSFGVKESVTRAITTVLGRYTIPMQIEIECYETDEKPASPLEFSSYSVLSIALEKFLNDVAAQRHISSGALRLSHFSLKKGGEASKESVPLYTLLKQATSHSDFDRKESSYRVVRKSEEKNLSLMRGIGIGISRYDGDIQLLKSMNCRYPVKIELQKKGDITLTIPFLPDREGVLDLWKQEVAHLLELDEKRVFIEKSDEERFIGPKFEGCSLHYISRQIKNLCLQIKKRRFREALPIVVSKENLGFRDRWDGGQKITMLPLSGSSYGVAVVTVKYDPLKEIILPEQVELYIAAGNILSKELIEEELRQGVTRAFEQGYNLSPSNYYYLLPLLEKVNLKFSFVELKEKEMGTPISDLPFLTVLPAFMSAVSQIESYSANTPLYFSQWKSLSGGY